MLYPYNPYMKFKLNITDKSNFNRSLWVGTSFLWVMGRIFLVSFILLFVGCKGTGRLPAGERLYTGAAIKIESTEKMHKGDIRSTIESVIRPQPNTSYFGLRPQVWAYMYGGENPKSGFKKWIKKQGQEPVLISAVNPAVTASVIDAALFNIGIFNSKTTFEVVEKKHTASVIYTSHIHKPFTIKELTYSISDDSIGRIIVSDKNNSIIKPGEDYSLDILKAERVRIDALLKNKGYFYFNPDYLLFKADTLMLNNAISFKLTLKDSVPENAKTVYHINNVFVNQNYSLNEKADSTMDTLMYKNTTFMGTQEDMNIYPKVILNSVYLRKNEVYTRRNHNITLNRLMTMGNFKFVQVKFSESDTTANGYLDATVLMTPMTKFSFRSELDMVYKSNNYVGPRVNLSILDRNTFKGAEFLNLSLAGSFEAQLSKARNNSFSYSINPQIELTFPRFVTPFNIRPTNSIYVPKTTFSLSYNFLSRVNYFNMGSLQFSYGFKWKNSIRVEHEFNPISISNTTITNRSAVFDSLLSNPFLKKSYEEQFVAGANYSFTYSEQMLTKKKLQFFVNVNAETAGNLFSLINVVRGETPTPNNPSQILGAIYSQFAKLSIDGRAYYNLEHNDKLAFRVFAGAASSYQNSSTLPYSKQFFSGGPNSIRAFSINSLGPGTYQQTIGSTGFLQLGGDIKLESNAEFRFGIYKYFKGALFVDAGNVWLRNRNAANLGSPFAFNSFLNELAVGAGAGLRVDLSFFVLRFDVAMPLRKPWLPENERWVINQINLSSSTWRTQNLILNIAIGYPF